MSSVVLLHGWPGAASDYRRVLPQLPDDVEVVVPDLNGYGAAFTGSLPSADATAEAQAHRILSLIRERALEKPVIAGYDIGSRVAQALARLAPDEIGGLAVTPAYPGIADRFFAADRHDLAWYQFFHRNGVAADLIDGDARAVRVYLSHTWRSWTRDISLLADDEFDDLIRSYSRPGAFRASIEWYRANQGYPSVAAVTVPTIMLWPELDPLFPIEWADRLDEFFTDVSLRTVAGSGHFVPLEAPRAVADAIVELLGR